MTWGEVDSEMFTTLSSGTMSLLSDADIELPDVARLAAERLVGLNVDAIGAIVEIEIVDVRRAHVDLQGVADLLDGYLQAARLGPIDVHHELRIVGGEGAEQAAEVLARIAVPHQTLGDVIKLFDRVSALVLYFESEAAEAADAGDRRRQERKRLHIGKRHQRRAQAVDDSGG